MSKFYKAVLNANNTFSKKNLFIVLFFLGIFGTVNAQVSVTATAGNVGPVNYTTLKAAFDAINSGIHQNAITILITGNTVETATAVLNSSGLPSVYTSVSIRPSGAGRLITGSVSPSIIKLNGADNVTIDGFTGSGPARDLTINNSIASTTAAVIWVASASAANGANNNVIKNCIVTGNAPTTTFAVITQSSGTTLGDLAETSNSNNTYTNNLVTAAQSGIHAAGPAGNEDAGTVISGNVLGSSVATSKFGHAAIFVSDQKAVTVSGNTITGVTSNLGSFTYQTSGIYIGGTIVSGGIIEKNVISDIKIASVWGCNGIELNSSSTSTGLVVKNNFIFDIAAGGYTDANTIDDNGFGIAVNGGGGYKIYYNSIDLSTNELTTPNRTAAFWVGAGIATGSLDVRDNIFSNRETSGTRYAIYTNSPANIFSQINYNDYYSTGSVGFLNAAQATLANWQAVSGGDVNSVSVNPFFNSITDLHLAGNSPLDGLATSIGSVSDDIDGNSRNATTPDIGADEFTPPPCVNPVSGGTAVSSVSDICASGAPILSSTGYSFGTGISYQWQFSTVAGGPYTSLAGQTNPLNGIAGTISATRYYILRVQCSGGAYGYSNEVAVTVNNPAVTAPTGGTRCGVGTTNLSATGSNLKWYAAPTGGSALGTGNTFTTPVISATTTFYVTASSIGSTSAGGKTNTAGADGGYNGTDAGLIFDATTAFTILSVKMYPQAAGDVDIQAFTSAGALIPGCTYTAHFTGPSASGVVVPINFPIPVGTSHRLVVSSNTNFISIWRDFTSLSFPYPLGTVGSITNGWLGFSTNAYYFFYDWQVTGTCESTRTPVVATVTTPPAVTVTPASATICSSTSVSVTASSSTNPAYVYTWNPGALSGPTQSFSPTSTTTYTVSANDGTCRNDVPFTITVTSTPTPLIITTQSPSVCTNTTDSIKVTGGLLTGLTPYTELAETAAPFSFTLTNTGSSNVVLTRNTTYFQQGSGSIHLTHGDFSDGAIATGTINLAGYTGTTLSFWHIAGLEGNSFAHYDKGTVEYWNGTAWVAFTAADYAGTGAIIGGTVTFDNTSYPDWDAQFSSGSSTPGVGPATSLWKHEVINLPAAALTASFKLRFHLTTDVSIQYYGWLIDNIQISGTAQGSISWSPIDGHLYTNATHTTVYAGGNATSLWFWTATTLPATTYTATVGNSPCVATASTTIDASLGTPTLTISANPGTTICSGSSVTFTAVPVGGGSNPSFQWLKNGTPVSGAFSTVNVSYTLSGLVTGDVITAKMNVAASGSCSPPTATSNAITMTVNPKPTANPITGANTVCTGTPSILTEAATGTITNYQWQLNGSPLGPNATTLTATLPGSYNIIVTASPGGCKDTSAAFAVTQPTYTITATAGPNGTINPSGVVVVNCGNNQTFTITPNPGYSVLDVLVDGVSVGALTTYTFNSVSATHTISATFFIAGCATPATSNAGPNGTVCGNLNYTLAGTSIGGSASTAVWSTSGTGTFNPSNVYAGPGSNTYTPSAADVASGSVTITLTTDDPPGSCIASTSTMLLTVKKYPAVTITGQIGLCTAGATSNYLVADTSATTININNIQWYHAAVLTPTALYDSLLVSTTGNYSVVVSSANGCINTQAVTVNIFPAPSVTISGSGLICTDAGVDINATAVAGSGTVVSNGYKWYLNGSSTPIGGAITSVFTATIAGSYTATATNSNGCISPLSNTITLAAATGPLNGNYTIGAGPATCTNYLSFARAINDLNTRGISGNVFFNIAAGYTETVPTGGLKLGSALLNPQSAIYTTTFLKSSAGANPQLIAYASGTGLSNGIKPDGIWALRGVNNVSINEIDLAENPANIGNGPLMEYGYGLFRNSATDGAQNNTIQKCTITLDKSNSQTGGFLTLDGSTGILVSGAIDTAATTLITPTTAAGANSTNKFYSNTIQNCHTGIGFGGYAATTPFTLGDTGNDVGGTSLTTGNNIVNFGNTGDASGAVGVRALNQWGLNVSYNSIVSNNGSGAYGSADVRGVKTEAGTSASATINNNTIVLKTTAGSNNIGIDNGLGSTAASNTILIQNNNISDSGSVTNMIGIQNTATAANVVINSNKIQSCYLNGTGTFAGIVNTVAASGLTISNNIISGNTKNGSGNMNLIGTGTMSTTSIVAVSGNTIGNNSVIIGTGITATTLNCILGGTSSYTVDLNTIYNNGITGLNSVASVNVNGYNNQGSPLQEAITNNTIRKLYIDGTTSTSSIAHNIRGIWNNTSNNASNVRIIKNNQIDSLYSKSTFSVAISGIVSQLGYNVTITKNRIHSLFPGQNPTVGGAFAKGIYVFGNGNFTAKISNNYISLDLAQAFSPAANGVLINNTGLAGMDISSTLAAGSAASLYYNTIHLAGSGAAGFGSSGIYLPATGTTIADMRNNIVANVAIPGSGGLTVALRRGETAFTNYSISSNNNVWYTTQTTTTPIYYNSVTGSGVYASFSAFRTHVSTRESSSLGLLPAFVDTSLNNLHLSTAANCTIEGAGTPISGYVDDYDGDTRDLTLPDIGADEFNGTGSGYTWKGLNTDWTDSQNWCGGVPTTTSDVTIPAGKAFYPIIITPDAVARNIIIATGGSITINATGTLSTTGTWTNNGILTNNGLMVLNGTTNQVFPGTGTGTMPAMTSLTINNAAGATFNKPFIMTGVLKPKSGAISVNDIITLHSDPSGTASVDTVQGSIAYGAAGKFVVERYISSLTRTGWRFLSAPISGTQTINQAWQEGQAPASYTSTGFGMQIVGPFSAGAGFDLNNTLSSLKKYDPVTSAWVTVPGTTGPIAALDGYMAFIRGDRGSNTFGAMSATTLRTTGPIKTGAVTVSAANTYTNKFISVGNPYPAAINFASVATVKTNLQDVYYVWDPKLNTYGNYQTFAGPGYVANPGGGSYSGGNKAIESGEAFFIVTNATVAPHSITVNENSKIGSNVQVARSSGLEKQLSTKLYLVTGSDLALYDGNRVDFDPVYSNEVDDNDALKMTNFGESFGLMRHGKQISVERHAEVLTTDTLFYQLGLLRQLQYQLEFTASNLAESGLTAYLEDNFLHTSNVIDLSIVNHINFTVTSDAGSKAEDRFRLVFKQLGPLPVTFTSIRAVKQDKNILVSWKVESELNISRYEIERSANGRNFTKSGTQNATGTLGGASIQYSWLDIHPYSGDNFYRIKSVDNNGNIKYSEIVKVNLSSDPTLITVFPNPVGDDRIVKISMSNEAKGNYYISLLNNAGQVLLNKTVNHEGGNAVYDFEVSKEIAHGNYLISISNENGVKKSYKIVY